MPRCCDHVSLAGSRKPHEICSPDTYMHAVQVSHGSVDKRLERRCRDALEDARRNHAFKIVARCAAPSRRSDQQNRPEHKHVTLAPDAARGHDDEGGATHAQQIPARELGDAREGDDEVEGQGQGVGGQNRTERGGKDGGQRQDEGDEVALPQRPVERVVGVVGRLRDEDDGHRPAGVAFEAPGAVGGNLRPLGVVEVSGRPCDEA